MSTQSGKINKQIQQLNQKIERFQKFSAEVRRATALSFDLAVCYVTALRLNPEVQDQVLGAATSVTAGMLGGAMLGARSKPSDTNASAYATLIQQVERGQVEMAALSALLGLDAKLSEALGMPSGKPAATGIAASVRKFVEAQNWQKATNHMEPYRSQQAYADASDRLRRAFGLQFPTQTDPRKLTRGEFDQILELQRQVARDILPSLPELPVANASLAGQLRVPVGGVHYEPFTIAAQLFEMARTTEIPPARVQLAREIRVGQRDVVLTVLEAQGSTLRTSLSDESVAKRYVQLVTEPRRLQQIGVTATPLPVDLEGLGTHPAGMAD